MGRYGLLACVLVGCWHNPLPPTVPMPSDEHADARSAWHAAGLPRLEDCTVRLRYVDDDELMRDCKPYCAPGMCEAGLCKACAAACFRLERSERVVIVHQDHREARTHELLHAFQQCTHLPQTHADKRIWGNQPTSVRKMLGVP
jgi:hypothetical protein